MTQHFNFPDKTTAEATLRELGWFMVGEDGSDIFDGFETPEVCVKVLGTMEHGGEWDAEGNTITAPQVSDGYHVDMLISGAVPEPLVQYQVFPQYERHTIGGGNG